MRCRTIQEIVRVRTILVTLLALQVWPGNESSAQVPFVRQRETNPSYTEGDWVSYSVARYVTSIAVGREFIYFGTANSGITRFHQYREEWDYPWTTSNGLTDNEVSTVAFDADTDFLWCATRHAISYYQSSTQRWRNAFKEDFGLPENDQIVSIGIGTESIFFEASSGRILEASKYGGILLVSNSRSPDAGAAHAVRWFGRRAPRPRNFPHFFMTSGYLFDVSGVVEDPNFRRAEVVTAVEDKWGSMWIGTWGLGAGRGDMRSLRLDMLEFGLGSLSVDAMIFNGDVLWAGSAQVAEGNHGITAWDTHRAVWQRYEQRHVTNLLSDQVYSITADPENLWFSTGYGLSRFTPGRGEWYTFDRFSGLSDNLVFDVAANDSLVLVGTDNGIDRIVRKTLAHKDSVEIEPISPGNLALTAVRDLELMGNLLWAATNRGIYVYDLSKRVGGFSDEYQGPFTDAMTSVSRYRNELWFGSVRGIDVFDTESREWLGSQAGRRFDGVRINQVLAAKEAVWAATDAGLMKFNRKSKSWRTFTTADGLISDRVLALLLDGDYIWCGTDAGLTQFFWNAGDRID